MKLKIEKIQPRITRPKNHNNFRLAATTTYRLTPEQRQSSVTVYWP